MTTHDTTTLPDNVIEWANDVACDGGEEGEHTLNLDPDGDWDHNKVGHVQVWTDDPRDMADGTPGVGAQMYHVRPTAGEEWLHSFSPDQALEFAAYLIVHALLAREQAINLAAFDDQ